MELISREDLLHSAKIIRWLGGIKFVNLIFKWLKINRINEIYARVEFEENPQIALDIILEELGVKYSVNPDDLLKLPDDGAFILMSNHPFGGIDGVIMAKIFGERYPTFKILVNYFLCRIKPIASYFIPVNPFEKGQSNYSSIAGLKSAIEHVRGGAPLGIFPAGQVSAINDWSFKIEDIEWKEQIVKLCSRLEVPIFPIYFEGRNSLKFSILGLIHPSLRTALIPAEFVNKRGKNIRLRIGDQITKKELDEHSDTKALAHFIRSKSYELSYGKYNKCG